MTDDDVWKKLTESEKLTELEKHLNDFRALENGKSEYYDTYRQGKIKTLKTEIKNKICKIIDLEHVL
jgi:hypothetical protein